MNIIDQSEITLLLSLHYFFFHSLISLNFIFVAKSDLNLFIIYLRRIYIRFAFFFSYSALYILLYIVQIIFYSFIISSTAHFFPFTDWFLTTILTTLFLFSKSFPFPFLNIIFYL